MTSPDAELKRVLRKYPPMGWQDLGFYLFAIAVLVVASLYREGDWYFLAGMPAGVVIWEFTKFRLRRNARDFVRGSS